MRSVYSSSLRTVAWSRPASDTPVGNARAAVLFIGAARAMVWPAVCENIHTHFLEAIRTVKSATYLGNVAFWGASQSQNFVSPGRNAKRAFPEICRELCFHRHQIATTFDSSGRESPCETIVLLACLLLPEVRNHSKPIVQGGQTLGNHAGT